MRVGTFRLIRLVAPFAALGLLAGCFQPVYGDLSFGGGPNIRSQLATVDVSQIPAAAGTPESRIAVNTRNALVFGLSGGENPKVPRYRLNIQLASTRETVIVDLTSARPELENFGLNATYTLTEVGSGKVVVNDVTFARVTYDIPGEEQRFAQVRGLRDAENRAAEVIADAIRTRLASYFVAGT